MEKNELYQIIEHNLMMLVSNLWIMLAGVSLIFGNAIFALTFIGIAVFVFVVAGRYKFENRKVIRKK